LRRKFPFSSLINTTSDEPNWPKDINGFKNKQITKK
jgi:hypothetical protein